MTHVPFRTAGFPAHVGNRGRLYASMPILQWAAITVGVSPVSASPGSRPLAELTWRSALMEASLSHLHPGWHRSSSYTQLDASEKSAVSYFLGMAQAQLTCARILGVPSLVHVDAILRLLGRRTRKSRPDFLGVHPRTSLLSVAVEAKGRTHGYTDALVSKAKAQSRALPGVTGVVVRAYGAGAARGFRLRHRHRRSKSGRRVVLLRPMAMGPRKGAPRAI